MASRVSKRCPFANLFTGGNLDCSDLSGHRCSDHAVRHTMSTNASARGQLELVRTAFVEGDDAFVVTETGNRRELALVRRDLPEFAMATKRDAGLLRRIETEAG